MFERYSDRSRRIIFLSRKIAGQRGAAEIGLEDLLEALVAEDQGEFGKFFSRETPPGAAMMRIPEHAAFLTPETAAAIRREMEPLLARAGEPLPTSVDMSVNDALKGVLERAEALDDHPYESASPAPVHHGRLEPLHLLAAVLEDETSAVAAVLHKTGVLREDVMRAMREGNSA